MVLAVTGFSLPVFVLGYILVFISRSRSISCRSKATRASATVSCPSCAASFCRRSRSACLCGAPRPDDPGKRHRGAQPRLHSHRPGKGPDHATNPARPRAQERCDPDLTTVGLGIALLVSGVVVTETVLAIPGVGRLTVDAIVRQEYPVIQASCSSSPWFSCSSISWSILATRCSTHASATSAEGGFVSSASAQGDLTFGNTFTECITSTRLVYVTTISMVVAVIFPPRLPGGETASLR
jgi:hypothetical protein